MNWTPINKRTGIEYDPVDDAGKKAMESDPQTKGKYRFKATDAATKAPKTTKEKAPLKPIGVEIQEVPNEYDKKQA